MEISSQLKGGIYEVSFGFHSKLDGYATLMADIPTLYAIPPQSRGKRIYKHDSLLNYERG